MDKITKEMMRQANHDAVQDDGFIKPGFDARLSYNRQVERYMMGIQISMVERKADDLAINLFGLWGMFNPFIKPSQSRTIKELIREAQKFLRVTGRHQNYYQGRAWMLLTDAYGELLMSGKHLLMPVGEEGVTEYDEDQFIRMSQR